jgi:hypothetical protein
LLTNNKLVNYFFKRPTEGTATTKTTRPDPDLVTSSSMQTETEGLEEVQQTGPKNQLGCQKNQFTASNRTSIKQVDTPETITI